MSWTLTAIKAKVQKDLNLEDEIFIEGDEFLGYVNEGIREAEAEIHKLSLEDDYFLTRETITLAQGTAEYDMPDNIYASKIRAMIFNDGVTRYPIHRLRGTKAFMNFTDLNATSSSDYLSYLIFNDTAAGGDKISFAPVPTVSGAYITMFYIRNANQLVADSDICDIPEFINFVLQFVKDKCINKERMTPDAPESEALKQQRILMTSTLAGRVEDGNNTVQQDLSHYEESI